MSSKDKTSNKDDTCQRFLFTQLNARGEWVHLKDSFQQVLDQHHYPALVQALIGDVMVAVSLLTATLKFEGSISLQVKMPTQEGEEEGPLSLLMAESTHDRRLRAMARYNDQHPAFGEAEGEVENRHQLIKDAQLVITISPKKGRQYQGIVAIENGDVAKCLESYFESSEQLKTRIWIYVDDQKASGVLIQSLPESSDNDSPDPAIIDSNHPSQEQQEDDWRRLGFIVDTLQGDEVFNSSNQALIQQLFPEDDVQLFDAKALRFECSCSLERSQQMLVSLGHEEVQKILQENPEIKIDCQFCHAQYKFGASEIESLFFNELVDPSTRTLH